MPKTSKKNKFRGVNRWDVEENVADVPSVGLVGHDVLASVDDVSEDESTFSQSKTASERKLGTPLSSSSTEKCAESNIYRLVELLSMMRAFEQFHKCTGGKLDEDETKRYGNSSYLKITCSSCKQESFLQTSGNNSPTWRATNAVDVNRRMVYSACEMSVGREAVAAMCAIFNMPPRCSKNSWDKHKDVLYEAHREK